MPLPQPHCPPAKMLPAVPQVSHPHWPWLDGGAISAYAAQGGCAGCSFLGQQVPAGVGAQVACRVCRIQDDGPAIPIQGQSSSWQHLGIYLRDCLNYSPPHPTLCRRQGQDPETPLCSRHTLEGRMEKKLHTSPFCLLYPGQTLLINHRAQAMLAPPACKAGIVNRPQHWFHHSFPIHGH